MWEQARAGLAYATEATNILSTSFDFLSFTPPKEQDQTMEEVNLNALSEKAKAYMGLYNVMMEHYRAEEYVKSDEMAENLLMNADIPVIIEARCHMILATSDNGDFLTHAEDAVKVLQDAQTNIVYPAGLDGHLQEAEAVLEEARRDATDMSERVRASRAKKGEDMTEVGEGAAGAFEDAMGSLKARVGKVVGGLLTPGPSRNPTRETQQPEDLNFIPGTSSIEVQGAESAGDSDLSEMDEGELAALKPCA